jgi:hypothetical protein
VFVPECNPGSFSVIKLNIERPVEEFSALSAELLLYINIRSRNVPLCLEYVLLLVIPILSIVVSTRWVVVVVVVRVSGGVIVSGLIGTVSAIACWIMIVVSTVSTIAVSVVITSWILIVLVSWIGIALGWIVTIVGLIVVGWIVVGWIVVGWIVVGWIVVGWIVVGWIIDVSTAGIIVAVVSVVIRILVLKVSASISTTNGVLELLVGK